MGRIRSLFLSAIFCFSFLSLGFSQTIILKSGQKVEGEIIEQTDKYVKLEFQGVEVIYYSDEISSIDQTTSGGVNTITPQMEILYKAYTASLNAPPAKKEQAQKVVEPVMFGKTQNSQAASVDQENLVNSVKDQERVRSAINQLQDEKIKQVEDNQ